MTPPVCQQLYAGEVGSPCSALCFCKKQVCESADAGAKACIGPVLVAVDAGAPCDGVTSFLQPQLRVDKVTLGFGQPFGSGTYIGTKPVESFAVSNGGQQPLVIARLSLMGDSAFSLTSPVWPTQVQPGEQFTVSVLFVPTEAKVYSAKLR